MKAHGLKYLAAGLLLTLVVLPGDGRERVSSARPREGGEKPNAVAAAPGEDLNIDLAPIDLEDLQADVSRAMHDAERALDDADLQEQLAELKHLDLANLADLAPNDALLALAQETPEAAQEPGDSGNVFFFSTDDENGWLGVTIAEVTAEKVKELKLPAERGVLISAVQADSPAEKAGLKSGDVISELAGQRIEGTAQFRRLVRETPVGRLMALTVWRDGRAQTMSATLAARRTSRHSRELFSWPDGEMRIPMPPMPPMGEIFAPRTPRLGIDAEDLSGDLGKYFGAPDGEGVLVHEVRPGSPAEKAGLKAGDVIIKAAGERVKTTSDLRASLRAKRESKTVDVVVIRKDTEMTLPVEVERVTPPEGRRIAHRVAA